MEQSTNKYKGERLSFIKIFTQKQYKIVIPIIQRDYAQGRKSDSVTDVRTEFIDALFNYLDENKPNRDLDFVYGTLQKEDEKTVFVPLDGQQRLTTLFLLHWFLCQISKNTALKNKFKTALFDGNHSLFTYKTRASSTEFCDALMKADIDMDNLLIKTDEDEEDGKKKGKKEKGKENVKSLAATIANKSWFFRIWKNDPTVKSMLVMLDAIYNKFYRYPKFFERLMDEENPIVTFIFMDLKEFKLTDDLYIKMNSRGKPLTKFENFKAKFEQYIEKQFKNDNKKYNLDLSAGNLKVGLSEYFSHNIDTKWNTLFWQYCKGGNEDKLDTYIENFIRAIITGYYAANANPSDKEADDAFKVLINSDDVELKSLSFNKYESIGVFKDKRIVQEIVDALDAFCGADHKIPHLMSDKYRFYYNEEAMFEKVLKNNTEDNNSKYKLSYSDRIRFYAYTRFLIRNKGNNKGINDWMRVVHNLAHPDNSLLNSADIMARDIKAVENLLEHSSDIITYLQKNIVASGFSEHQRYEETLKALLISKSNNWKEGIESIEQRKYFNGQIGFMLEFAGICEAYNTDKSLTWTTQQNNKFLKDFNRYAKISRFIFELDNENDEEEIDEENNNGQRVNTDYCFERAVLSHGDYLEKAPGNNYNWNLLSTDTTANNVKRDLSWKRFLRLQINDKKEGSVTKKTFIIEPNGLKQLVKETFDNIADENNIVDSLKKQFNYDTGYEWRNKLIKYDELIELCGQGFMTFSEDQILLLSKSATSSVHWELFTYNLYCEKFYENEDSFPGFNIYCYPRTKLEDKPQIELKFFYEHHYVIYIETLLADYSDSEDKDIPWFDKKANYDFDCYRVTFAADTKTRVDYPEEIVSILKKKKFVLDEETNRFVWESNCDDGICEQEDNTFKHVKDLAKRLYELKAK